MLFCFILLVLFLIIPDTAFAWGPATHLELGWGILNHLKALPPSLQELLSRFPYDYLYGTISADVVIGKNLTEEDNHCHNWRVGHKVLKNARTESQRAFAYGYMSHLAADTIAHNRFVPEKFVQSFSSRTLRHTYWEMRYDALVDKKVWKLPKKMSKLAHRDNDILLKQSLEGTPLSFRTNKTIFSSIILINRMKNWHRMLDMLSRSSRWTLSKDEKQHYYDRSLAAIKDFLINGTKAGCCKNDPTGRTKLATAKRLRKQLKKIKRNGKDWEHAMKKALVAINQ